MGSVGKTNRPQDRDFYNYYRPHVKLPWLADNWQLFRTELLIQLPPPPVLDAIEQSKLFEAAAAVRVSKNLLDKADSGRSGDNSLPPSVTLSAALRLLLTGTIKQLGHWENKLPTDNNPNSLLSRLHDYLINDMRDFRDSINQCGNNEMSYYLLDSEKKRVIYSTKDNTKVTQQKTIDVNEAILVGFLWWAYVSEWCWDSIEMN